MNVATQRLAAWLRTPAGVLVLGLLILFLNGLLTAAFLFWAPIVGRLSSSAAELR